MQNYKIPLLYFNFPLRFLSKLRLLPYREYFQQPRPLRAHSALLRRGLSPSYTQTPSNQALFSFLVQITIALFSFPPVGRIVSAEELSLRAPTVRIVSFWFNLFYRKASDLGSRGYARRLHAPLFRRASQATPPKGQRCRNASFFLHFRAENS